MIRRKIAIKERVAVIMGTSKQMLPDVARSIANLSSEQTDRARRRPRFGNTGEFHVRRVRVSRAARVRSVLNCIIGGSIFLYGPQVFPNCIKMVE